MKIASAGRETLQSSAPMRMTRHAAFAGFRNAAEVVLRRNLIRRRRRQSPVQCFVPDKRNTAQVSTYDTVETFYLHRVGLRGYATRTHTDRPLGSACCNTVSPTGHVRNSEGPRPCRSRKTGTADKRRLRAPIPYFSAASAENRILHFRHRMGHDADPAETPRQATNQ